MLIVNFCSMHTDKLISSNINIQSDIGFSKIFSRFYKGMIDN